MKYILIFFGILFLIQNNSGQVPANDNNWAIEFADNFDSASLFDTFYTSRAYSQSTGIKCNETSCIQELQSYQRDNITYENGILKLTAKKETIFESVDPYLGDNVIMADGLPNKRWFDYTSGAIMTRFREPYGYFEIRARMPKGRGFWPAFWLHYFDGCDKGKEIDIFEPNGRDSETCDIYGVNMHFAYTEGNSCINGSSTANAENLPDLSLTFHKFAVEWAPGKIYYYCDDKLVRYLKHQYVPETAMYIIANLAIDPWTEPDYPTFQSKSFEIDYIKYYQLKKDCIDPVTSTEGDNFNFISFDYKVKKSFSIKNSTVPSLPKVTLRATDFIEFTTNFEVPIGSEFNAVTIPCY